MKRRRSRRHAKSAKRQPTITTRLPPWGATKQAADCFQKIRDLKNQVFALEQKLIAAGAMDTSWHPTGEEIHALGKIVDLPVIAAEAYQLTEHLAKLARWYPRLVDWNRVRLAQAVDEIRKGWDIEPKKRAA